MNVKKLPYASESRLDTYHVAIVEQFDGRLAELLLDAVLLHKRKVEHRRTVRVALFQ